MLSILIADDTPEKIRLLKDVIYECISTEISLETVNDTCSASNKLSDNYYDLLLLDMFIPFQWGDAQDPKNAIDLLHQIVEDEDLKCPLSILAMTKLEDLKSEYRTELESMAITLLRFAENSNAWKPQLKNKLNTLIGVKRSLYSRTEYDYDVAIINALQTPEFSQIQSVFGRKWDRINVPGDDCNNYYVCNINSSSGNSIRCVSTYANQMASIASATLTTKVIYNFRPRYLFMTGIAAGIEPSGINFGDILVASEIWDGASGKIKESKEGGTVFMPDFRQKNLSSDFMSIIQRLMSDDVLLSEIARTYPTGNGKPNTNLKIHLGPMASVPAVLSCQSEIEKIQEHSRKLQGIEMEAYGMFYAAFNAIKPIPKIVASLKSVSDFADYKKEDNYQEYAAYTSAALLKHIIVNELSY